MRTLNNTQITKIENVVYNVLDKILKEKGIDMTHVQMIDKNFKNTLTTLKQELEDDTKYQFENEIEDRLTQKNIEECVKYCLFDTDSNYKKFEELVKIGKENEEDEEDEEDEEEDEYGNIIVIENDDVYDYDYKRIVKDFNDSYFANEIVKVDNLDNLDNDYQEQSDFLFKGLHLNFDNTCSILTLQTSANYKEKFIDLKIEEICNECNNIKSFDIKIEELKEIFFNEFDRRYQLDSEDFEEIYEYSLSKIKSIIEFLEEEIEEKIEERNEKEIELKK